MNEKEDEKKKENLEEKKPEAINIHQIEKVGSDAKMPKK